MPATLLRRAGSKLFIEDNTFYLADPDDPDSPMYTGDMPMPDRTGLIAATERAVGLTCGVHVGPIAVTVETWDTVPQSDLDTWDDIAEVSVNWPTTEITVCGADVDPPTDLSVQLPPSPERTFRVRAAVRNRDAGEDRDESDPVEEHLIQIWAAPPEPETLVKATDEIGARWRARAQ